MSTHITSPLTYLLLFFFNDTATTEIYTLSLHDALPISGAADHLQSRSPLDHVRSHLRRRADDQALIAVDDLLERSEEHTSELQSQSNLVCRLLLEKKKKRD